MDKRIIVSVIAGVILFCVLQILLLPTLIDWLQAMSAVFEPTSANLSAPRNYFAMIQSFHVLALVLFVACLAITVVYAFRGKKLYAIIALVCYALIVVLLIVARCTVPAAGVLLQPSPWDTAYASLYIPFRNVVSRILIALGVLSILTFVVRRVTVPKRG